MPLQLFIPPADLQEPANAWAVRSHYGYAEPRFCHFTHYQSANGTTTGQVCAAATGKLSVRPPDWAELDPRDGLAGAPAVDPNLSTLRLYLHVSPQTETADFAARAAEMSGLRAFAYVNLDPASVRQALATVLANAPTPGVTRTAQEKWRHFVAGDLSLYVTAGTIIGQGASAPPPGDPGAPTGLRFIGFAAVTDYGNVDPSYAYDWMRAYVQDGPAAVDAFLQVAPVQWPVLDATSPNPTQPIETGIYSMPVLEQLRRDLQLNRDQFRFVGDCQKALYRERLLARTGHAPSGSLAPAFEFDSDDWRNVFQLEAVSEFYANYRPPPSVGDYVDRNGDPWASNAVPSEPGAPDAIDRTADFLDPEGDATVVGSTVRFSGPAPLPYARAGLFGDTIYLEDDLARASKTYSTKAFTQGTANGTPWQGVSLYGTPTPGPTRWRINQRPVLVIIDPLGARDQDGVPLAGSSASVDPADSTLIHLDGSPDLTRVNRERTDGPLSAYPQKVPSYESGAFDTIYFPSDMMPAQSGRPARTYRIVDVPAAGTVRIDGTPLFANNASDWHIPAGVGGRNVPIHYNLGPNRPGKNDTRGSDHYDGAAFVVFNGRVHGMTRTSTYTSRYYVANDTSLSSVRGNGRYFVRSVGGGNASRNYALSIEDFSFGPRPAVGERPPENYGNVIGTRFARYYFGHAVGNDSVTTAGAPPAQGGDGKVGVLLHYGLHEYVPAGVPLGPAGGSGSAGCFVSPVYGTLRDVLITIAIADYRAANPTATQDPAFARLKNIRHDAPPGPAIDTDRELWDSGQLAAGTDWYGKITCTMWLIRPDERPL